MLSYKKIKSLHICWVSISVSISFHNLTPLYINDDFKYSMSLPLDHGGKSNWPVASCLAFTLSVVKIVLNIFERYSGARPFRVSTKNFKHQIRWRININT